MAYKWVRITDELIFNDKKVGEVTRSGGLYKDEVIPCDKTIIAVVEMQEQMR